MVQLKYSKPIICDKKFYVEDMAHIKHMNAKVHYEKEKGRLIL